MSAAGRAAFAHQEQVANAASLAKDDILKALDDVSRLRSDMRGDYPALWLGKLRTDVLDNIELRLKSAGRWLLLAQEDGDR